MTNWEYLVVVGYSDVEQQQTELNELGSDGWELISVIDREGIPYPIFYSRRQK